MTVKPLFIQENFSLKKYNTFNIDAKAQAFASLSHPIQLEEVFRSAPNNVPLLILGDGSNVLFTQDFEGLVVHICFRGIQKIKEDENFVWVRAAAGENWHAFVQFCIQNNWGGVENLSLIPGTVGAAPMQNIGAYGVEIKEVFESLEAWHITTHQWKTFTNQECEFGYRESVFKNKVKDQYIIGAVTFKLHKKHAFKITYGDIQNTLQEMGVVDLSIQAISEAVIKIRSSKLPDPTQIGNAGSFFKNPMISISQLKDLQEQYPHIPYYPFSVNDVKVPAAWLIEQCGWKGYREGEAGVHARQALVLVNYGGATGKQLYDLSEKIKLSVKEKFNIALHTEVNIY